jgi:hypothetical protein
MTLRLKAGSRALSMDPISGTSTLWRGSPPTPAVARELGLDATTRSNCADGNRAAGAFAINNLLSVENLAFSFNVHGSSVDAVRGVSFRVPVEVALVGEAHRLTLSSLSPRPSARAWSTRPTVN